MFKQYVILILIVILLACLFIKPEPFDTPIQILNVVLFSKNNEPYERMQQITNNYYKKFNNVHTYYYCYDENLQEDVLLKDNILYLKGSETYIPGILEKTILVLEYFRDEIPKYNYVIRTNISTIVRFDLLEKNLRENPIDYGCAVCFSIEYNKKKNELPENQYIFSSGTSIIFTPEVALNIINNKDKLDKELIDDVSIGKFIQIEMPDIEMKSVMNNIPNNGFLFVPSLNDREQIKQLVHDDNIVIFRNNNGNRELDADQMNTIVELLNEKDIENNKSNES
jgi:hypothetical protein